MKPRLRIAIVAALILVGAALASRFGVRATYQDDRLTEPSGLTAGQQKGVFWTHNDSGDGPVLYAVTIDGRVLARFRIEGAEANDWEAITADRRGQLYVGDIGNNANSRRDLTVYEVPEPRVPLVGKMIAEGVLLPQRVIRFHYPEQTAFPPAARNFDAEALFWDHVEGGLYLLTKHRGDMATVLYRFDDLDAAESAPLSARGRFVVGGDPDNFGGMVTGADLSPDGRLLAVLTYHALFIFERPETGDDWLSTLRNRIDFDQTWTVQAEAVVWHGASVVFTNEQGAIFRIDDPLAPREDDFP